MDFSTLLQFFAQYGLLLLFLWLLVGIFILPVPEEVVMLAVGILISRGDFSFWALPVAIVGSICGVTFSYSLGRFAGAPLLAKYGKWIGLTEKRLAQGDAIFEKYGKWSLPFGYFIPGSRHFVSLIAGTSHFEWRAFALYAYPAGIAWVTLIVILGYLAGDYWLQIFHLIVNYIYTIIILCAIVITAFLLYWFKWRKK